MSEVLFVLGAICAYALYYHFFIYLLPALGSLKGKNESAPVLLPKHIRISDIQVRELVKKYNEKTLADEEKILFDSAVAARRVTIVSVIEGHGETISNVAFFTPRREFFYPKTLAS